MLGLAASNPGATGHAPEPGHRMTQDNGYCRIGTDATARCGVVESLDDFFPYNSGPSKRNPVGQVGPQQCAGCGSHEFARLVDLSARPEEGAPNDWYCRPMAKIFLTHPVADYETWRAAFDQDAARHAAYGLTIVSVLRDADDPNRIWVVADGEPDKVNEMMQDPGLASVMERAGVTGPPELFIAG